MTRYIHQIKAWPGFTWKAEKLEKLLAAVRHRQGRLLGYMEALGFQLQSEAMLQALTQEILKSNEIEGELLDRDQVRSSIARRLGMDVAGLVAADRNVDGVVDMMLNATQLYRKPLNKKRLFGWHAALFPTGHSGMYKIIVAKWRDNAKGPMQVVSGPMGKERVHYEAPNADRLEDEMKQFLHWFNQEKEMDPVLKAGIAHLWFVTIHPFDDGNGRMARAIADMQLCRADSSHQRFYSMSAQIRKERKTYYSMLEETQHGTLDITEWLQWFLACLDRALAATDEVLSNVIKKARFWEKHRDTNFNDRQRLLLNKMMDGFEGKLNSSKWAKIGRCSSDTALRDIQELINLKVLDKDSAGGRSTSYNLLLE